MKNQIYPKRYLTLAKAFYCAIIVTYYLVSSTTAYCSEGIHLISSSSPRLNSELKNGKGIKTRNNANKKIERLLWKFKAAAPINKTFSLDSTGILYVCSYWGILYALHSKTGKLKWQRKLATDLAFSSPVVDERGAVYIGTESGKLYSINKATGQTNWIFTGAEGFRTPALGPHNTILIGTYSGEWLTAVDRTTGKKRWAIRTGRLYAQPVGDSKGNIYVGSAWGGILYCIRSDGKAIQWQYDTNDIINSSVIITPTGLATFGCYLRGDVYAIRIKDGKRKWRFRRGGESSASPVLGKNGIVYIGCSNGILYALDSSTGRLKGRYRTGERIMDAPAIDSNLNVYVGSHDNMLHVVDGKTMKRKWVFKTQDWVEATPVLGNDGTVYIGSYDRHIYAVRANR